MNRETVAELNRILAGFWLGSSTARGGLVKQLNVIVDDLRNDLAGYQASRSMRELKADLAARLADFSLTPPLIEIKKSPRGVQVSGYASVFGPLPDMQNEIIDLGAFSSTLAQHRRDGTAPIMLFGHDQNKPIGTWTGLAEDNRGLRVTGTILSTVRKGREAISLLEAKSINGLSIGFRCKRDKMVGRISKCCGRRSTTGDMILRWNSGA
jgi:HK97 family phage prohead protease